MIQNAIDRFSQCSSCVCSEHYGLCWLHSFLCCVLLQLYPPDFMKCHIRYAVSDFVYRSTVCHCVSSFSLVVDLFLGPLGFKLCACVQAVVRIFWAAPLMLTYFCLHRRYLLPKTLCLTLCTGFSHYFHHGCSG